jgi:hypothetical protein
MPNKSNSLIISEESNLPSIPNMKVDKDKLDRPYAKVENDTGDWYKQTKLKNGKTKREMVSDN